jgi:O-acetyl-ADP-ribose deacetylase (regulator of RNase III)
MINITFVSIGGQSLDALKSVLRPHEGFTFNYMVKRLETIDDLKYDVCVSPANSFGELQGGVDMVYYRCFGRDRIQSLVYDTIMKLYSGEILVGDCCPIDLHKIDITTVNYLLLCPTMTIPLDTSHTRNAYFFTRALIKGTKAISKYLQRDISVLCPMPCTGVGMMDIKQAADQVSCAFDAYDKRGLIYAIYQHGDGYELKTNIKYPELCNSVMRNAQLVYMAQTKTIHTMH